MIKKIFAALLLSGVMLAVGCNSDNPQMHMFVVKNSLADSTVKVVFDAPLNGINTSTIKPKTKEIIRYFELNEGGKSVPNIFDEELPDQLKLSIYLDSKLNGLVKIEKDLLTKEHWSVVGGSWTNTYTLDITEELVEEPQP